jgi:PIN domain nuclease of toxin-antitoxin system
MRLLFDIHTFIWWDSAPGQLSSKVLELCHDPANTLLLSVVSVWEIQIKAQVGKLTLHGPLAELVTQQQADNDVELLPVLLQHVLGLDALPLHHRDPFDRLLLAQAQIEGAVLLSRDEVFGQYNIPVVW